MQKLSTRTLKRTYENAMPALDLDSLPSREFPFPLSDSTHKVWFALEWSTQYALTIFLKRNKDVETSEEYLNSISKLIDDRIRPYVRQQYTLTLEQEEREKENGRELRLFSHPEI